MNLVLARIDQRLIHGQVSVGWVPVLQVERILVVDDRLSTDAWERELVVGAAPPGVEVRVVPAEEAVREITESSGRLMVLVRTPAAMLDLVRRGCPIVEVNVGGLHAREGSVRVLDYLHVSEEDTRALAGLHRAGIRLGARDLPGNPEIDLGELLDRHRPGSFPFLD